MTSQTQYIPKSGSLQKIPCSTGQLNQTQTIVDSKPTSTRTNYLKYSFFPYTTVVWNNLPYQLNVKLNFQTLAHQGVARCSLVFNVLTLSYFSYTFLYVHPFTILYICKYVPTNACAQHLSSNQALSDKIIPEEEEEESVRRWRFSKTPSPHSSLPTVKCGYFLNLSRHIYVPTQILLYGRCADFYSEQ